MFNENFSKRHHANFFHFLPLLTSFFLQIGIIDPDCRLIGLHLYDGLFKVCGLMLTPLISLFLSLCFLNFLGFNFHAQLLNIFLHFAVT